VCVVNGVKTRGDGAERTSIGFKWMGLFDKERRVAETITRFEKVERSRKSYSGARVVKTQPDEEGGCGYQSYMYIKGGLKGGVEG
jgi:hypothetical protein